MTVRLTTRSDATAELAALVSAVRAVVQRETEQAVVAEGVAEALRAHLDAADLLSDEQRLGDPSRYRQHILHVEPDGGFSIVALVWLPGQKTPIHDHVSWCVVGVYQGEEHETVYELIRNQPGSDDFLRPTGTQLNPTGSVCALVPPGDIHHVANEGAGTAISLHIYGADIGKLGSSIRRRYDHEVRAGG